MNHVLTWTPIWIVVLLLLFYILWSNGYLIKRKMTAVLFIGLLRFRNRCRFKFKYCNGYIKKVIKVRESRYYEFSFKSSITNGRVTAEIQDKDKRILLQLDKDNPEAAIRLEKNYRYYLVIRFIKADGEIDLAWKQA